MTKLPRKLFRWAARTANILVHAAEVCGGEELKLAMNIAFSESLRIGELTGLAWDCVDISSESLEERRSYIFINKGFRRDSRASIKQLGGKDILVIFLSESRLCPTVRVRKTPENRTD